MNQDLASVAAFHRAAGTELAVSTRTLTCADVLADHYRGTPPDCETVLRARNGDRVELLVPAQGH